MMRKYLVCFAILIFIAVPSAFAAVSDSPHDIDMYQGPGGKNGVEAQIKAGGGTCSYCHVPHKAAGARLFPSAISAGTGIFLTADKVASKICFSCHASNATTYLEAAGQGRVFGQTSFEGVHGDNVADLVNLGDASAANISAIAGMKLDNATSNPNLECTSCHDPHRKESRPFMANIGGGGVPAGEIGALCVQCHINRNNTNLRGSANTKPIQGGDAAGGSQHLVGVSGAGQTAKFKSFTTPYNNGPVVAAATAAGDNWVSQVRLNGSSAISCNSCHLTHGNDDMAGTDPDIIYNNLLWDDLDTRKANSAFCTGCHEGPNPIDGGGDYTPTHPVDGAESSWSILGISKPTGWYWGQSGTDNVLLCYTCHDVHYGNPNTALWAKNASPKTLPTSANSFADSGEFCNVCHANSSGSTDFATNLPNHHPIGSAVTFTTYATAFNRTTAVSTTGTIAGKDDATGIKVSTSINWATYPPSRTTGSEYYAFYDNNNSGTINDGDLMACGSCHFGSTNYAHGDGSTRNFVASENGTRFAFDGACIDCHDFNPAKSLMARYSLNANDNNIASHYVGPMSSYSYRRTDTFAGTGYQPLYANSDNAIVCSSCHSWDSTKMVASNNASNAWSPANYTYYRASINGIGSYSGNNADNNDTEGNLCTACHGSNPGGGGTHPVVYDSDYSGDMSGSSKISNTNNTVTKDGYATLSVAGKINCESCHRPHFAGTGTGALILEASSVPTPASDKAPQARTVDAGFVNQEASCYRCHER